MADENVDDVKPGDTQNDDDTTVNNPPADDQQATGADAALIERLVSERVDTALKSIKDKLDKAYSARDEALGKVKEFERKEREESIRKLQEDGKHREASELAVSEERSRREAAERKVVELTRDLELKSVLGALNFRNQAANEMARRDIVEQLVQNEAGDWVHRSGVTIDAFVKDFAAKPDNAFLFKPKVSSGGGSLSTTKPVDQATGKSLFAMSQDEVLKQAANGGVRRRR